MARKANSPRKNKSVIKINRIKAVLAELDIQQKELAQMIGVSPNSIARICSNQGQPTLGHLRDIAIALGVNIQDLLIPTPVKPRGEKA